ncbi:hypothetical protein H0A36_23585 [Endozoicomonas sp. SM1973]|uniref:Uncharacterized protein n=1 Tax=Spartinivicinus marinus TaxID=2994442 RepID=A0A853IHV6_9GAMM|nr:DUF5713 family protein [Spartinivicinus marinus]MCX4026031.1 DUF5713 family protein [Spartinivicinus marinus]NYZ69007.1 hypothetical protein [Spartinivicinus marinus]
MSLKNEKMADYKFLADMYKNGYFPNHLVDKGKEILIRLCKQMEDKAPSNLEELYQLTHAATEEFNDLAEEFEENDSEIETAARDCIGVDIENISISYGFEADIEELIAPRDW